MDLAPLIDRAADCLGGSENLAVALGVHSGALRNVKARNKVSPELAIAIHRVTKGKVPASELRPDLWRRPSHVPSHRSNSKGQPHAEPAAAG